MKKTLLMLVSALLLVPGLLLAGSLDANLVSADAQWLVHTDVSGAIHSEMGQLVESKLSDVEKKKIGVASRFLGINIKEDIQSVTVYGPDANEKNAVVLIQTKYDKQRLLDILAKNPEYSESSIEGNAVYSVTGKHNRQVNIMFASSELIIVSQSKSALKKAFEVSFGLKPSLAVSIDAPLASLVGDASNSFFVSAVNGISSLPARNAIVQNIDSIAVSVAEQSGNICLNVNISAVNEQVAQQIEGMLVGLKAFANLKHSKNADLMSILNSTILFRNSEKLTLTFQYPSVLLFEMRNDMLSRMK